MLLREFIYFDQDQRGPQEDDRYLSQDDITSVLRRTDLRKTRLTLKMINELRRAGEAHQREREEDLGLVRKMYAAPTPETGGGM